MSPQDFLRFDASARDRITKENSQILFDEYTTLLHDPKIQYRLLWLLEKYGLQPAQDGHLEFSMQEEPLFGATLIRYYYKFQQKTTLQIT